MLGYSSSTGGKQISFTEREGYKNIAPSALGSLWMAPELGRNCHLVDTRQPAKYEYTTVGI